jgi:hypothetical protein
MHKTILQDIIKNSMTVLLTKVIILVLTVQLQALIRQGKC